MCTPIRFNILPFYLKDWGWGLKGKQWEVLQPPQLLPVRFKGVSICFQDLNQTPVSPFKNGQDGVFFPFFLLPASICFHFKLPQFNKLERNIHGLKNRTKINAFKIICLAFYQISGALSLQLCVTVSLIQSCCTLVITTRVCLLGGIKHPPSAPLQVLVMLRWIV